MHLICSPDLIFFTLSTPSNCTFGYLLFSGPVWFFYYKLIHKSTSLLNIVFLVFNRFYSDVSNSEDHNQKAPMGLNYLGINCLKNSPAFF